MGGEMGMLLGYSPRIWYYDHTYMVLRVTLSLYYGTMTLI